MVNKEIEERKEQIEQEVMDIFDKNYDIIDDVDINWKHEALLKEGKE